MAEGICHSIWRIVQRKRGTKTERSESISLGRCLNSWDLTALGVGRTLGIGVYVLMGGVALKIAGPSIVLSFLIAALAALLAGLCYAEFGARVPLAGSAYIYTYVSIGELVAFMVGWINILEFVFASASIARSLSVYLDTVTNHSMSDWFQQTAPLAGSPLSPHFDLFSFLLVLLFGIILAIGVRESSLVNGAICSLNLLFILFIIIAGAVTVNVGNWSIPVEEVPLESSAGGFFPYGVWGTLKGAAVCFYCFVGFEVVAAAAEEVKGPRVNIPTSIVAVLSLVFLTYAAVSIVLTMMVPYYEINTITTISSAFSSVGWDWPWWIVNVGAIFGLSTSLYGAIFPLPRLLHSMAADGLLFHWFAKVSNNKQSPIIATVVSTLFIAVLSGLFELEQLVLMLCIGTLASYTLVAVSVVLLRHRSYRMPDEKVSFMKQMFGCGDRIATRNTKRIINITMLLYVCTCITAASVTIHTSRPLVAMIILHVLAIIIVFIMALQPANDEELSFKTPLVPFLPCISIYVNIHLAVVISWQSWIRILIWLLIGLPIYLICISCYTQTAGGTDDLNNYAKNNGKHPTVKIVVESPTPPHTVARFNNYENQNENIGTIPTNLPLVIKPVIQEIQIENNEEKEAKIIDLLDQVLQAEEDSYSEVSSLKDTKSEDATLNGDDNKSGIPHRKSLSELSDAGSDASMGNQVLSKYDVIAEVHREDLPKLNEEEEDRGHIIEEGLNYDDEEITAFNESETNSRTDESGYSDTIDRPTLCESIEDTNIPVPPPLDEDYFKMPAPLDFRKSKIVASKQSKDDIEDTNIIDSNRRLAVIGKSSSAESLQDIASIPVPPPFDENYFKSSAPLDTKKFNTVPFKDTKADVDLEDDVFNEPRLSIQSDSSQGDGNIRFGSSRQIRLMSKLNDIFQKTINNEEDVPRSRSQSIGNFTEADVTSRERPQVFLDLKKELLSRESLPNLRHVNVDLEKPVEPNSVEPKEEEDQTMTRKELKNKLENIFAVGGPQLLAKPRLIKSNPPTPEEAHQTDVSSTESIPKLPKMEKNDTLKRQKDKFSQVLNSFRLSMNNDDNV